MKNKNKIILLIISIVVILIITIVCISMFLLNKKDKNLDIDNIENDNNIDENEEDIIDKNIDIVNISSSSRPYAVVVNNTPVAVKVQEGLNKAYLVYEIPTEGNTSRLMALYKDAPSDLVIGTIRSARHNFIDFALESDAIFCCFGWSHYAQDDMKKGSIDYIQGLYGQPYYRNNPEGLALEHTAYINMSGLIDFASSNGIRTTSDKSVLLNYHTDDVNLSLLDEKIVANTIIIPYGAAPNITTFKYNNETKMYSRYENDIECIDHNTKESVTTKNIIIQKIGYSMCADNYYWNLSTVGAGEGYYITNGYAIPIIWNKSTRESKTKYMYKEGTIIDGKDVGGEEILVSDGRTYIEIQPTNQNLEIQ